MKALLPFHLQKVGAGFPSPATDYVEDDIDLNSHLIKNIPSTFLIRVQGKFGDVEQGVESNQIEIKKLNNNLELKTDELAISINSSKKDLTESLGIISTKLDDMDINAVKARKRLATDIGDLKNELEILDIYRKVRDEIKDFVLNIKIYTS